MPVIFVCIYQELKQFCYAYYSLLRIKKIKKNYDISPAFENPLWCQSSPWSWFDEHYQLGFEHHEVAFERLCSSCKNP